MHTPYPTPFCLCCCAFPNCSIRNVCNSFGLNPELKLKIFSKNCAALLCAVLLCATYNFAARCDGSATGSVWRLNDSVEKKAEKTQTEEQDWEEVPEWVGKRGNESDCHRQRQRQQCQSLAAAQMLQGGEGGAKGGCRANGNGSALSKVVAVVGLCFVIARGNGTSKAI